VIDHRTVLYRVEQIRYVAHISRYEAEVPVSHVGSDEIDSAGRKVIKDCDRVTSLEEFANEMAADETCAPCN